MSITLYTKSHIFWFLSFFKLSRFFRAQHVSILPRPREEKSVRGWGAVRGRHLMRVGHTSEMSCQRESATRVRCPTTWPLLEEFALLPYPRRWLSCLGLTSIIPSTMLYFLFVSSSICLTILSSSCRLDCVVALGADEGDVIRREDENAVGSLRRGRRQLPPRMQPPSVSEDQSASGPEDGGGEVSQ